jgi:glycine cleavage system T protein (aminomethyltransferase)
VNESPLAATHARLGARMTAFAGWRMPVQYGPILEEASAVRSAAGLFDLCHMGRLRIRGGDALLLADRVLTNDVAPMKPGEARYALLCNPDGGVIDDVLVYREPDSLFVVVNAGNRERDVEWIRRHASGLDAKLEDLTEALAMVALQGPASARILAPLVDLDLAGLRYYRCARARALDLPDVLLARTGYTGEDGFELFLPVRDAERAFAALLHAGAPHGLRPIGLGARDTLRLEAGMPLYGHEIDETTNPIEAGLAFAVRFTPGKDFVGRKPLEAVAETGPARRLVGFRSEGPRIPRQGYALFEEDERLGAVCSGTKSPTLGTNIGTGYVPSGKASPGTRLSLDVHGEQVPAEIVPLPFYSRTRKTTR